MATQLSSVSDRVDPQVSRPAFDVVVPAYNEASHIDACLDLVLGQDYPAGCVRVWVVDAGSTDATAELVRIRARLDARISLVRGLGRLNAGQAMNAGIASGSAEFIARVDAHTVLAPDYLSRAAELLEAHDGRLACVGGQPEQVGETLIGRGIALARRSRFGVGGSVYADRRTQAYVDTVQAGVYRRSALAAVGGFAIDMLVGEDEELNWRLRRAGYFVLLDRRLQFRYTTRSTWRAAFRQYDHYGQSRARVLAAHPGFLRPRHLVPSALLIGVSALAAASTRSSTALTLLSGVLMIYAAGALAAAVRAVPRNSLTLVPTVALSFPALHFGYAIGLLKGAAQLVRARLGRADLPIAVVRR